MELHHLFLISQLHKAVDAAQVNLLPSDPLLEWVRMRCLHLAEDTLEAADASAVVLRSPFPHPSP